jgi:hypothetical protein
MVSSMDSQSRHILVVFEGNFTEGSYDGFGIVQFPDGRTVRGNWKLSYPTQLSIERPGRSGSITYKPDVEIL